MPNYHWAARIANASHLWTPWASGWQLPALHQIRTKVYTTKCRLHRWPLQNATCIYIYKLCMYNHGIFLCHATNRKAHPFTLTRSHTNVYKTWAELRKSTRFCSTSEHGNYSHFLEGTAWIFGGCWSKRVQIMNMEELLQWELQAAAWAGLT